jgi:hypothetical protein
MRRGGFVVKHCNKRRVNSSIVLPVLFIIIFISGCVSHVKELREAQDHFNSAASIENQVKTGDVSGERIVLKARANTSYHLALNTASDLLENKKQELQDDNLLGSAYSLKALSEWRIGNYPAAIATLGMLNRNPETQSQLFPRDMALIQALSGLIKNDQAALHMTAGDYEFESIITLLIEAVEDIDSGIALVKAGDEVRLYLSLTKLAAIKNWADLRGEPDKFTKDVPTDFNKIKEISRWCRYAVPSWNTFKREVALLGEEEADLLDQYWGKRLAIIETCPE